MKLDLPLAPGKDCPLCRGGINEWGHTSPCYAVQRELAAARAECERLRAALGRIEEWTHAYGAELKPPSVDTYGEGVRDSKARVGRLLAALAESEGGG